MTTQTLEQLQNVGRELIGRAQREMQEEDWHLVPGWDINAWKDDDNQWRLTAYPATSGETDVERGIVLRGCIAGCYDFPSIDTLKAATSDENIARELRKWWTINRSGPKLLISPTGWGENRTPVLEVDIQSEVV